MNVTESVLIALRGLTANKLRSALTMLGIIIGVGAVIALMAVGSGFEALVRNEFENMGTNLLIVMPGTFSDEGPSSRSRYQPLTVGDAEAIEDPFLFPDVVAVSPLYYRWGSVIYGGKEGYTSIIGVNEKYDEVNNAPVEYGRPIEEEDLLAHSRVAILGETVLNDLFEPDEYPIGERIRIQGISFEVIGVLKSKGSSLGSDNDDQVLIPITTAQTRVFNVGTVRGDRVISYFTVQVASEDKMDEVADDITELMRERHNINFRDEDDFSVASQKDFLEVVGSIVGGLTVFLGIIAGISLMVGGIGIMNIMLVSVTERTREIGIRKAVGAKRRDILMQFLVEAMVLSMIGGFVGIGLGFAAALVVTAAYPSITTLVTLKSVLLSTGFAAAVGLFFGIYPATRAARLNPIDALRYE